MNAGPIRTVAAVTAMALVSAGCTQLTPGENAAVFGGMSAAAAGSIARAAGASTGEALATGAAVGAVVAATTYIIAKHQATERQRRIAEERARQAYRRIVAQQQQREAEAPAGKRPQPGKPTPHTAETKPAKRAKKLPRYIAVDTERDERTSPKAQKSVMIWDTQSQEIVGNNVYDVSNPPAVGATARFETYSAEYVGTGS